jgi:hypothetical protein
MIIDGVLTPAYGRDYKSTEEAQRDFDKNLDFRLHYIGRTCYINKEQFEEDQTIQVRFNRLLDVGMIKVNVSDFQKLDSEK